MKELDLSRNRRIPMLMELMNSVKHYADPLALLDAFIDTVRGVYGNRGYAQLATDGLAGGEFRILYARSFSDPAPKRPDDPHSLPVLSGGVFSQLVRGGGPKILHDLDLREDPVLGNRFAEYKSAIAAPIFRNDLAIDWVAAFDPAPHGFAERDLEDMIFRANLVGTMVSNLATARKLAQANARIRGEIEAIARIQRSLLPDKLPAIPGLHIAASYNTFDTAGGDLYDILRLGGADPRWAILIGDVSGHGPAAAVVMAMFHAIFHTYPLNPAGPGEVLGHVNRHLCAKSIDRSFVTAFLAFYDPRTRELIYARAGHPPPLLKTFPHAGAPHHLDEVGELPLGIFPDVCYSEARVALHPGQTLILYTDGITEARRPDGLLFGVEGIETSLIECSGAPDCAIGHIAESLTIHQEDIRPSDDQTMVAIQVVG